MKILEMVPTLIIDWFSRDGLGYATMINSPQISMAENVLILAHDCYRSAGTLLRVTCLQGQRGTDTLPPGTSQT